MNLFLEAIGVILLTIGFFGYFLNGFELIYLISFLCGSAFVILNSDGDEQ